MTTTANLTEGQHRCAFLAEPGQRAELHARFVTAGLSAGDRVVLVHPQLDQTPLFDLVAQRGIDVQRATRTGQLLTIDASVRYGDGSQALDSEQIAAGYAQLSDQAKREGFPALRVSAEIHDMLGFAGFEELVAYERRISDLVSAEGMVALCQYERDGFASGHRNEICRAHHGEAEIQPVAPWLRITPCGDGRFELSGELDRGATDMVERVIDAADARQVVMDVSDLSFVDAGGWRVLTRGDVELTGRSTALERLQQLIAGVS
jgi:hypothetical protein